MAPIIRIKVPAPFPPGNTSCYFIPDSTPTLIDPGINTPEALQGLQDGLKKYGMNISDIGRIILTHGHSDHSGSVGKLAAAARAAVFVHSRDRCWTLLGAEEFGTENAQLFHDFFKNAGVPDETAREKTAIFLSRVQKRFTPVDMQLLQGGEVFTFDLLRLKVLHTPGHSPGSISLFDEKDCVLLTGDTLIRGSIPFIYADLKSPADLPQYRGLEQHERSLDLLGALPARMVLPGHGAPFGRHLEVIGRIKRNRARRCRRIQNILLADKWRKGPAHGMTQFEIACRLFSSSAMDGAIAIFMILSEVRSCLEVMEKEGVVDSTMKRGNQVYYLKCLQSPESTAQSSFGQGG
jgi:glyoxylase-like metal-dependent hydrolase (beta-lactamase superfamily II)